MINNIIVSVSADRMEYMHHMLTRFDHNHVSVTEGADTRHRSIYNAVKAIPYVCPDVDIVIIHDAVRPVVDEECVLAVVNAAFEHGAAGAVRSLVSTVVCTDRAGFLDHSLDRLKYRASEMPQAFKYDVIKLAYDKSTDYDLDYGTECLHLAQQYGGAKVWLVEGPDSLWKITHRKDIIAFEGLLKIVLCMCLSTASISQVDVISNSRTEYKALADGIRESLHAQVYQEVPVSSYLREECAAVECTQCCSAYSHSSAVVFLYDSIDTYNELFQLDTKCSYSVVIIVVLVKSASVRLCGLRESVKQFADGLPDEVIANGVVINEEDRGMWKKASRIIASVVAGRNSAFSGQIFFCLS